MPSELTTVRIPFRLRDATDGAFVLDTTVSNYDIRILKDGVLFTPTLPAVSISTAGLGGLGRHLLVFGIGVEAEYAVFIDYTGPLGHEASIEGAYAFVEKFRTSELGTPTEIADSVWATLLPGTFPAGSAGVFLKRILQLAQPDVEIDPTGLKIRLRDKDTAALLIEYDVSGIIDSRITDLDG